MAGAISSRCVSSAKTEIAAPCPRVLYSPSATGFPAGTKPGLSSRVLVGHMAIEICQDGARMNCEGANSNSFAAAIEFYRKQYVCGFRVAVGSPPVVSAMLKIRMVKVDSGTLVTPPGEGHDARAADVTQSRPETRR